MMKKNVFLRKNLVGLAVFFVVVIGIFNFYKVKVVEAAWFGVGWQHRVKLTIDHTKVSADQTDFPVYVNLNNLPAAFHSNVNQTDGRDIRVTKSDGTTELPREVVFYTAASDTGELHFKYTGTLSSTVDTDVYIYYGNASASDYAVTDTYGTQNVWNSNYKATWHFTEASGTHYDSTSNNNDSSAVTVTTQGTANSKIGGADGYDGVDDVVNMSSPTSLDNLGPFTFSAWIYPETCGEGGYGRIINKSGILLYLDCVDAGIVDSLVLTIPHSTTNLKVISQDNTITFNAWQLVTVTWDDSLTATNVHVYFNGSETTYQQQTNGVGTQGDDSANNFFIGNNAETAGTRTFNGQIDEMRVSSMVRSSTWISTEYNNQSSPSTFFSTFGGEETEPTPTPTPSPTENLFFKFDEGYGTTTADSSSNRFIGTLAGATKPVWQTEDLCISGKCLYFNGSTASVTVASTLTSMKSTSFWVKPKTNGETLVDFDGGTHYIAASAGNITATGFSSPTYYINGLATTTPQLVPNVWQHIEVTTSTAFNASSIKIGNNASAFLNGFVDEFRIHNTQRTAAQVKSDFNSHGSFLGTSVSFGDSGTGKILSSGLVGYWKMDENSGNATDASGNGLTLTNNGTTPYGGGKFARGSEYVPASSQYFSTTTTIAGVKTISFWVNPDSTTNYFAGLTAGAYLTASAGTIAATGFTNPTIYVNGIASTTLVQDVWQLVTVTTETGIDANQFYLGRQDGNYYDGTIDEVRIYNRTFSPAEVRQLANWAPGPVGHWRMDENTGESVYDASGNDNLGTMGSSSSPDSADPKWATGKYGSGVKTGVDDYVNIPDNNNYSIITTGALTVETWINIDSESGGQEIITKSGSANYEWDLSRQNGGTIKAGTTGLNGTSYITNNTSTTVPLGQWAHIAFTIDTNIATPILTIYINGVIAATDIVQDGGTLENGTMPVRFGMNNINTYPTYGSIDDVRIYNYVRTPAQIAEDMLAGRSDPLVYWKFDEGYGLTANNSGSGGSSKNGTITSGAWTGAGKLNKALTFSASTSVTATITNSAYSNAISLWVYPTTSIASKTLVTATKLITDSSGRPTYGSCVGTALSLSTWTHVVAISNGSGSCAIYQNGLLAATGTTGVTFDTSINVGATSFTGSLDEFTFFNFPITSEQVKVLYNQNSTSVMGAILTSNDSFCPPGQSTPCVGPVGYWKMDENTGNTSTNDSTGNNGGNLEGGLSSWKPGKYGSSLNFDGVDDRVYDSTASWDFTGNPTKSFTLGAWFKRDVCDGTGRGISLGSESGLRIGDGSTTDVYFQLIPGGTFSYGSGACAVGVWTHIEGVYDAATTTLYFYWNGRLADSDVVSSTDTSAQADVISLGKAAGTVWYDGQLDDVRVYDYARTSAQVVWDYNGGAPIAWWKMDECAGDMLYDASLLGSGAAEGKNGIWSGASGTNTSAGTCTTVNTATARYNGRMGKYNAGLDFDSVDDKVTITNTTTIDLNDGLKNGFTIGGWIYPDSDGEGDVGRFFDKGTNTYCRLGSESVGQATVSCRIGLTTDAEFSATTKVTIGQWNHVVFSWTNDSDDEITIWVNGIPNTSSAAFDGDPATDTTDLTIGNNAGQTTTFDGKIDDFRIFGYEMTLQQIKMMMNDGAAKIGP